LMYKTKEEFRSMAFMLIQNALEIENV